MATQPGLPRPSAGRGVGVARAAEAHEGGRAAVLGLDPARRVPAPVRVDEIVVRLERRVVAGVGDEHPAQGAVRVRDAQEGKPPVRDPVEIEREPGPPAALDLAPGRREGQRSLPPPEAARTAVGERRLGDPLEPCGQHFRIAVDPRHLVGRERFAKHVRQEVVEHRPGVDMGRADGDVGPVDPVPVPEVVRDGVADRGRDADQLDRDDHDRLLRGRVARGRVGADRHRARPEVVLDPRGLDRAAGISAQADRELGRYVPPGEPDGDERARHLLGRRRRSPDRGHGRDEP
jgi:hypothetical protein